MRHGDPIALGVAGDACADVGDDAGEFATDGQRQRLAGHRVWLGGYEDRAGVILVQVSAQIPLNPTLTLTVPRFGFGHIGHLDLVRPVVHSCFHDTRSM